MSNIFSKILRLSTLLSTSGFIGAILIQIYSRFFLPSAPAWTEEASRFFFVYAISFAAGLAMKDGEYVCLDIIYNRMNSRNKRALDMLNSGLITVLFLILGISAIQYVELGSMERSPGLTVSMSFAFASLLILSASVGVYAFLDIMKNYKQGK